MDVIDCLVIGAGVVGLACARELARAGRGVVIVERERTYGTGVSSRSSEVVHAGLYDTPGTLKASLCVRGNALLTAYCEQRGVPHRVCGKLVVASRPEDEHRLEALRLRAMANGVAGLKMLTRAEARAMEPALACAAAMWSPFSGIVDSHALMTSLLGDAEAAGALWAGSTAFDAAWPDGAGWRVRTRQVAGGGGDHEFRARWLVNAAGLDAQHVAGLIDGVPAAAVPPRWLARGHYFGLRGRSPFSRLIYPLPVDGGLGVHLTLDLAGRARFGPDVEWIDSAAASADLPYTVDPRRAAAFEREIQRYWPGIEPGALSPAYCGIRPKLSGPGEPPADFRIDGPARHGCDGLVQLFGIESPGLTSALSMGEQVREVVAASG